MVNEFCLVYQKCGRVFECDDYEYFEENQRKSSTALPTNDYLKNILRKYKIDEMFSSSEVAFLGNVCSIQGCNQQISELHLFFAQLF